MQKFTRLFLLVMFWWLAGCTFLAGPASTPTVAAVTPARVLPTFAVPPTATQVKSIFVVTREQPVNCRYGPGTVYAVVGLLNPYQSAQATGRNEGGTWWHVRDPGNPGGSCWLAASAVDAKGAIETLPVVEAPQITVSKLEARVEPQRVNVLCSNFPQYVMFTAEITTNGPALVTWHWEIITGEVTGDETLIFEEAGTQTVYHSFVVREPNDYWTRIHVTSPNALTTEAGFFASCTP